MSKLPITVSINPTYFCNFDCNFCYLTKTQLNDKALLDLDILKKKIEEISEFFHINCVDIYGGEVGLLAAEYLEGVVKTVESFNPEINIITNLSKINDFFYDPRVNISVSWESEIRRSHQKVFENMKILGKDIHLLMLAGKEMLAWDKKKIEAIVQQISSVPNIKSVEIKPYSSNQANQFSSDYIEYEEHIKSWMELEHSFIFVNHENLKNVLGGVTNSFSDDHIYISPTGELNVLDFDRNDHEYFKPLTNVEEYFSWANLEKIKVSKNSYCSKCTYLGNCLSEHLRDVQSIDKSCNGFYQLIEWYKNERI